MAIEAYYQGRLVSLKPTATVYEAARALEANHIGMIVVQDDGSVAGVLTDRDIATRVVGGELDPHTTSVGEVMTRAVWALPSSAEIEDVIDTMVTHHVRRVPILEGNRAVGVVSLDDLVVTGAVDPDEASDIVRAQLEEPAARKPAGDVRPYRAVSVIGEDTRGRRHAARAAQTMHFAVDLVVRATGLSNRALAERALDVAVSAIVRRLSPREAEDMLSQMPSELRERMLDLPHGPDRTITRESLEADLVRELAIPASRASDLLLRLGSAIALLMSPGQLEQVRHQLPQDMRSFLPEPVLVDRP